MSEARIVVWFSCGAASAVAAMLATLTYEQVSIVYCDTMESEHPDNQRFFDDVEQDFRFRLEEIKNELSNYAYGKQLDGERFPEWNEIAAAYAALDRVITRHDKDAE